MDTGERKHNKKTEAKKLTVWEVKNPRDPRLNDTMGGTAPLNRFEAWSITPSPPRHATKSTLSCRSLKTSSANFQ